MIPIPPPLPRNEVTFDAKSITDEKTDGHECALNHIVNAWNSLTFRKSGYPKLQAYVHMNPIVQEGPTCGLVVLSMVSSLTPKPLNVIKLLEIARFFGYSNQGEIFSVESMTLLAKQTLSGWFEPVSYSGGLMSRKKEIVTDLSRGTLLLIPYDADKNHTPACFKGHKAHWAVLCGILNDSYNCIVIARQGKSINVNVWFFDELNNSNANLTEISPCRRNGDYKITDISIALAGKYVALYPKNCVQNVVINNII